MTLTQSPEVITKKCADCGKVKVVGVDISWKSQNGKRYPNAYCKACISLRRGPNGYVRRTEPRPVAPEGLRYCSTCKVNKPAEDFGKAKAAPGGVAYSCLNCSAAWQREARARMTPEQRAAFLERKSASTARNPETRKRNRLKVFNLHLDEYEDMLAEQEGLCRICRKPEAGIRKDGQRLDLAVDHDHACCPTKGTSCGKCVRGLLCGNCNKGLGNFLDDPDLLRKAADYVERYRR